MEYVDVVNSISPFALQQDSRCPLLTDFTVVRTRHHKQTINNVCLSFNPDSTWDGDILIIKHALDNKYTLTSVRSEMEASDICQVLAHIEPLE